MPKGDAELDEKTLTVRFNELDVLFGVGSAFFTPKFQEIQVLYRRNTNRRAYRPVLGRSRDASTGISEQYGAFAVADASSFGLRDKYARLTTHNGEN